MVNGLKVVFLVSFYNLGINIVEGVPVPQYMQRYNGGPGSIQTGFNGAGSMPPNMNSGIGAHFGAMNTHGSGQPGFNQQASAGLYSLVSTGIEHSGPIEGEYGGENDPVESKFGFKSFIYGAVSFPYLIVSPVIGGIASILY
ncbi:hypothetical protein CONCODRAFT_4385 [Conidiobolus coronatus NRRL 28638]|uniref:Uncharacterized protein n=1 Tax=Conidiobolus coronatus (strain ATCC 28846 / CBS 209.66 / NRRL 28638) TaxID=796925 RepID=A0A137PCP9_CONC2|nr:hypothetical protein CONCODRAFT_4385 [Conidiobolus coronatus NRRL 28638]|eukprot:KXN72779.1 hypothetical protein CONCODRAFT_4385 [Conidiobolus coronatus NRRL 28638]